MGADGEQGIVSAVNSPIALVESMRFYEVAPHVVRHDEYYQSVAFMVHQASYDKLPADLKGAVDKAYAEAGKYSFELMDKSADKSIGRMKKKGVTFVEIDRSPFVKIMADFYKKKEDAGELPKGFLEMVAKTR